jgi:hypothetical protein
METAKLSEVAKLMGDITHDIKNLLMPIVVWSRNLTDRNQPAAGSLTRY